MRVIIFQERRYICFDGDLDPMYIEHLKTVMDNSKMLTLGNGECIRLENHCAILFEVSEWYKIKVKFMMFRSYFCSSVRFGSVRIFVHLIWQYFVTLANICTDMDTVNR